MMTFNIQIANGPSSAVAVESVACGLINTPRAHGQPLVRTRLMMRGLQGAEGLGPGRQAVGD